MIAGTAPTLGTAVKFDTRIGFVDANGSGLWDLGEFVVYDPNTDSIFDPKLMYIDSNNNNVWNPGETIIYKGTTPNSTLATFTGIGRCAGTGPPLSDCVIIGSVPSSSTILKIDTHIKFVDTNADGLWEPGEILVYDVNSGVNGNSGLYVANDTAIAPLTSDSKLRFIGSGSSWVSGSSTVVYDTNGNGRYDAGIMFVDDNFTGHWVQGDTVIYDSNHNDFYDFGDVPIYDPACALSLSSCDFQSTTKLPKNDPGLRFVDTNANGVWDSGEPVVYDSDINGAYETKLKYVRNGTNVTWVPGASTVWDSNNDG